jgi:hypothetical protein
MERIGQIAARAATSYDQVAMSRLIHAIPAGLPQSLRGAVPHFSRLTEPTLGVGFGRGCEGAKGGVGSPVRGNNLGRVSVSRLVAGFYEVIR